MKTYKGGRGIFMAFFRGRPLRPFGANPDTAVSIAALLLGLSSYVIKGSWWHYPKGCVLKNSSAHNYVFWNNVQTGRERNDWFVICQKSGMCGNSYCNVVYKVKGYNISFVRWHKYIIS